MTISFLFLSLKFFFVPILIGRFLYLLFTFKHWQLELNKGKKFFESFWNLPWYFIFGEIFIFALALILHYSHLIPQESFFLVLSNLINFFFYLAILINFFTLLFFNWKKIKLQHFCLLILIITSSFITYSCWLVKSPQPLNWDYYQHQLLADDIRLGNFSFFINEVSDTFGFLSYPPSFHLNLVLAQGQQQLNSQSIIRFWQSITYLHFIIFLIAIASLAQTLFKNKKLTFLTVAISALIFDSAVSFTSLFFLPQTFTAVWLILLLASLLQRVNFKANFSWWLLFWGMLFLIISHFVIGSLAALFLLAVFIYLKFPLLQKKRSQLFLSIIIISLIIFGLYLARQLDLSFINRGEAASYVFDFTTVLTNLHRFYGVFGLIGIVGGFFITLFSYFKNKNNSNFSWVFINIFLISTGILFSSFPYVSKFFTIFRFFYDLSLAIFIFWLLGLFKSHFSKFLILIISLFTLFSTLIANFYFWKVDLNYQSSWSHSNQEDEQIADLLWQHYFKQPVLLISDPATQHIIEGLSGINSAGGAYGTKDNRLLIANLYRSTSIENFLCDLLKISDSVTTSTTKKILAFSGRSFLWFESELSDKLLFNYNVWSPNNLSLRNQYFINSLKKSARVTSIYESPYMVILEVNLDNLSNCSESVI